MSEEIKLTCRQLIVDISPEEIAILAPPTPELDRAMKAYAAKLSIEMTDRIMGYPVETLSTQATTIGNNSFSTSQIDWQATLAKVEELRAKFPKPECDVYVMTHAVYRKVCDVYDKQQPQAPSGTLEVNSLYGMPIERFPTYRDAINRVRELRSKDVKAILVWEGDDAQTFYKQQHQVCPECGSDDLETTCGGWALSDDPVYNKDFNQANCLCGWSGIVEDLEPRVAE